jgi:hypothetical protein
MKSGWNIGELRKGRLLPVVVVLLLLHAAVDLAFPELCTEEPYGAGLTQILELSVRTNSNDKSRSAVAETSRESKEEPRPGPDSQPRDEDCFCCCTHVMPSPLFVAPEDANPGLLANQFRNATIPAPPPNNPYHPPRFV